MEAGQDAEGDEPTLFIRLPNALSSIEESRVAVTGFLRPLGIVDRLMNRVEVILEELVSNLVRHGKGVNVMTIEAGYRGGAVELVVEDDGAEFDPFSVPEPAPYASLAEAALGGLGIPLVRRLSKATRYDRIGSGDSGRNRVSVQIASS